MKDRLLKVCILQSSVGQALNTIIIDFAGVDIVYFTLSSLILNLNHFMINNLIHYSLTKLTMNVSMYKYENL